MLVGGDIRESTRIYYSRSDKAPTVNFGVSMRWDGIELSGPGTAYIEASWKFPRERHTELGAVDEWRLRLEFGVAGTDKQAVLEAKASHRAEEPDRSIAAKDESGTRYNWSDRLSSVD